MTPALRLIPAVEEATQPGSEEVARDWPWEVWAAFGVAVVAGLLALAWPDSTAQALLKLEPAERTALYQRTRASVTALCAGEPGLRDACREELRLLRQFPECDAACQTAATAAWPGPTR